jgi:hypothetical protein
MDNRSRDEKPRSEPELPGEIDGGRREVLKKLGIYAAYTAPALLVLMESAQAQAPMCSMTAGC